MQRLLKDYRYGFPGLRFPALAVSWANGLRNRSHQGAHHMQSSFCNAMAGILLSKSMAP